MNTRVESKLDEADYASKRPNPSRQLSSRSRLFVNFGIRLERCQMKEILLRLISALQIKVRPMLESLFLIEDIFKEVPLLSFGKANPITGDDKKANLCLMTWKL